MKVKLLENVPGIGKAGDVINVKILPPAKRRTLSLSKQAATRETRKADDGRPATAAE